LANKLSQSEIDALVASLLAADNVGKDAAGANEAERSPEAGATAAPEAQPAQAGADDLESLTDLGPVTQSELDAAVAASRAAKRAGQQPVQHAPGTIAITPSTESVVGAATSAAAQAVPAPPASAPDAAAVAAATMAGSAAQAARASAPGQVLAKIPPALRGVLLDIELTLSVELGKTRLPLGDILSMGPGSVITLDRLASEPLDVKVNGLPAMKAEVIAIGEKYGIRIVESQLPGHAAAS